MLALPPPAVLAAALFLGAPCSPPAGDSTVTVPVRTAMFGTLALADGEIVAWDGGTHGVAGHEVRVLPGGPARWVRRTGSFMPHGREGEGTFDLTPEERSRLSAWADAAWRLGDPARPWPARPKKGHAGPPPEPPRWVWVVAVRRGGEARAVEGDSWTGNPDELAALLDWLAKRVDALSEGAR